MQREPGNDSNRAQMLLRQVVDQCRFLGGQYGNVRCPKDWVIEDRLMSDYDVWFVHSGRGDLTVSGNMYSVSAHELYLFRPGDRISATQDLRTPLHVTYCHFGVPGNPLFHQLVLPPRTRDRDRRIESAFLQFHREVELATPVTGFSIRLLLYNIFQVWLEDKSVSIHEVSIDDRRAAVLRRAIDFLRAHVDRNVDLDELSRTCALEKSGLSRLFRNTMGTSPIRYHTDLRMQHAARLLESGMSVKQASRDVGYKDVYSFSKAFKKNMGVNPSAHRGAVDPSRAI